MSANCDLIVYPVSTANLFQALHYDNQMTSKRVRLFWTVFLVMFVWEIIPQCTSSLIAVRMVPLEY